MTHLSSLQQDALALGSLPDAERAAAEEHLAGCERCRADAASLSAARAHFTGAVLPKTLGAVRRRAGAESSRRRWFAGFAVALGAAAAVLIGVNQRRLVEEDVLEKGGAGTLQAYVQRDDRAEPVPDGTRLKAGDAVRLAVRTGPQDRFLAVLSLDGQGHVTRWFPLQGEQSGPVPPGVRIELPGSIVLDSSPGPEKLFAIFSAQPLPLAGLEKTLSSRQAALRIEK